MRSKEVLIVVAGALLLTNASIFGTLVASGHFDSGQPEPEASEKPAIETSPAVPEPPPEPQNALDSLADAMYLCRDKIESNPEAGSKSFSFDYNASFYDSAERVFHIFVEYQSVGDINNPGKLADIICDVSAVEGKIVNYKVLAK